MNDIQVGIQLKADGSGFVGELRNADGQVQRFGQTTDRTGRQINQTNRQVQRFGQETDRTSRQVSQINSRMSALSVVARRVSIALGTVFAGRELVDVTKQFETLEAQLRTATGSIENATNVLAVLQEFSRESGQSIESVTTAFTRLTNLGLNPSRDALLAYANVAAGTGKTTLDFVEAVADASTAEFERLKEFGIRARNEGEQVAFTFRGVTTRVTNDAASIEQFLIQLGQTQFGDAVANQSQTLSAALNRAGNAWDNFIFAVSEAGVGDAVKLSIQTATNALDELTSLLSSGQLQSSISAWFGQFSGAIDDSQDALSGLFGGLDEAQSLFLQFGGRFSDVISQSFKEFPANLQASIKLLTVSLSQLDDIAAIYTKAFSSVVVNELNELVSKVGAIGAEIKDKLNPFDGDTFDFSKAISDAARRTQAANDSVFEKQRAQLSQLRQAREASISTIRDERNAVIDRFNDEINAADDLRAAYDRAKEARENTELGQFSKSAVNESGDSDFQNDSQRPTEQISQAKLERLTRELATEREQILAHNNELALANQLAYDQGLIAEQAYLDNKLALNQRLHEQLSQLTATQNIATLGNYQSLFSNLAGISRAFGGEQSGAYKALFAVSKAFSVAQSIIAIQTGIAQASALPFPSNLGAIGTVVSATAGIVSTIKGTNIQGVAHNGLPFVPAENEGTYLLKRGEMVLNVRQRENFEDVVEFSRQRSTNGAGSVSGGAPVINLITHIDAPNSTPGIEQVIEERVNMARKEQMQEIRQDFASNGPLSRSLSGRAV